MSDNWKEKYLNKLEQFDKKQKDWASLEEFLRQTSSRLALAAEGNSKLLDDQLLILRKAIRKGESQSKLTSIMNGVSTELARMDKQRSNLPKGQAGFLSTLLERLSLSKDMLKKSKSIKKLLNAKNPPDDEKLANEFSQFFGLCVDISYKNGLSNSDEKTNKTGLFERLFNSSKEKELETDKIDTPTDVEETSHQQKTGEYVEPLIAPEKDQTKHSELSFDNRQQIEKSVSESLHNILDSFVDSLDYPEQQKKQLKEKLFSIKPTKEVHVLLGDLAQMIRNNETLLVENKNPNENTTQAHEILIRLLESIPMVDSLQKRADKLKENFSHGLSQSELPEALESIAQLIAQMQRETNEDSIKFQKFLLKMTSRLEEMDLFLVIDLKEHKDSWEKGVALGNAVKEHVEGIGKSVSTATDLKQLETDVQGRLDIILSHVETHRQNENTRVKRIQQQNQLLKDKINTLENESGELRNKILNSQEKAYTDSLTNLPNRLSYDQHLEEFYAHWQRYHENLILMVWDIDFFKKVNDNYGHQAGDQVLKKVAELLREQLRKPDFIARFGGEEFVSLLPNTSLGGGFKVAEKMRSTIAELEFKYKDQLIPLTISCGISLFSDGDIPEDVFGRADKALYQAKKQGRNRCVIAQNKG
ncbi:MAG: GGDEF domain-containing protein [Pseudomonadota bacterium]